LANGTVIVADIVDSDPNDYLIAIEGGVSISASVIMGLMSVASIIIAAYKLTCHIRVYGTRLTIAQAVFIIEIVSAFMRIWFLIINPVRATSSCIYFTWYTDTRGMLGLPMGLPIPVDDDVFVVALAS
jgi:hypothetical protein